jgi:hypothetical protein
VLIIPSDNKWLYHDNQWITSKERWYDYHEVHCPHCSLVINSVKGHRDNYRVSTSVFIDGIYGFKVICMYCKTELCLMNTDT